MPGRATSGEVGVDDTESLVPKGKSAHTRDKVIKRYLDVFEVRLAEAGYEIRRERRQLFASGKLRNIGTINFVFRTERRGRGDFFADFHDARHVALLAKMIGRKIVQPSVWVYVERMKLTKRNSRGRKSAPSYFFDISTEKSVRESIDRVLVDLTQRILPAYRRLSLGKMIAEGKARRSNMAVGFDPVGGCVSKFEIDSIEDAIKRKEMLERESHYWRRGCFIDLSALLALGLYDQAAWLIDRMPTEMGCSQGYLLDDERFSEEEWKRGYAFAKRILVSLRKGQVPKL